MPSPSDGPARDRAWTRPLDLEGPADEDLELAGPGVDPSDGPEDGRPLPDHDLPGGVDHTTAAVGGGTSGAALLGLTAALERWRRRRRSRDE